LPNPPRLVLLGSGDHRRWRRWLHIGRSDADLWHLIDLAKIVLQGATPWAAAGEIADGLGGDARVRHANRKTLYKKYNNDPEMFFRLAQAPDLAEAIRFEIARRMISGPERQQVRSLDDVAAVMRNHYQAGGGWGADYDFAGSFRRQILVK
jgi:hypothetical protein